MELNNIKDLWKKEQITNTPGFVLEKKQELRMPLERIRKNMRLEFWITIIAVLPLVFCGFVLQKLVNNERFIVYYSAFLISFVFIISFYFFKFFKLYQELEVVDFNTKDSLKDLIWKFKLNEQYYISYYVATVPVLLFEFAIFMDYLPGYEKFSQTKLICTFIISMLISLFFIYNLGKWWFRRFYGKHIYKIKKTLQIIELHENI